MRMGFMIGSFDQAARDWPQVAFQMSRTGERRVSPRLVP
jgi:hypothetical protein